MTSEDLLEVEHLPQRFVLRLPEGKECYLKYRLEGSTLYIDKVYTPEEYRNRGFAEKLVEEALRYAEGSSLAVVPKCSYAKRYFEKHPEKSFLLKPSTS